MPRCVSPFAETDDDIALLDLRGEVCPFTFVRTKVRLEELPIGARLRLIVDHPPAVANVPASLRAWGHRVLAVTLVPTAPGASPAWHLDVEKLHDE